MKRRDFLKLTGMVGAGAALPLFPAARLCAAHDGYTGPLWLTIEARGAWDPTSFIDPKGYTNPNDRARINNYPASAIAQVGNFRYAPPPDSFANDASLYTTKQFLDNNVQRLLVVNGIDCKTNAHPDGARHTWSGELARSGYPNFGALAASSLASVRPIAFISNGGYSLSVAPVVPVTLSPRNTAALFEIAYPERSGDVRSPASAPYFPAAQGQTLELIRAAQAARQAVLRDGTRLPQVRAALEQFIAVHGDSGHLRDFAANLDGTAEKPLAYFNGRGRARDLYRQGRVALAAYETGVTASAHLFLNGFDTHSDHDARHYPLLMDLLQGIDAILAEAQERNLLNRIVVVVGSDFGRTNRYNDNAGKDHWPITSMMFIGNPTQVIRGNRVVGSTSAEFKAVTINPATLQPDPAGMRITPGHIHRALRRLASISSAPQAQPFPLDAADLNIFG